jgi:hypothetical protein
MTPTSSRHTASARRRLAATGVVCAASASLLLTACGSGSRTSPAASSAPSGTGTNYQLLMVAFALESSPGPVIDPMTFSAAPGTPAAIGPLSVKHVAGITPARQADAPTTPLLGADGKPLGITLGQWTKAKGTVAFHCVNSKEQATSTLEGLIPSATYSAFAVHTALDGPRRFTPWGDAAGTTNNLRASTTGTATSTETTEGCSSADDIIIIWHSDGTTHGKSPGNIGVNWHTSLIAPES